MTSRSLFVWFALVLQAAVTSDAVTSDAAEDIFASKVAPLLERRCVSCHNDDDREGDLSLQTQAALQLGGEGGPVVDHSDPLASSLLAYVSGDDPEMPKDADPLTSEEVAFIRDWLLAGAKWFDVQRLEDKSLADKNWWSLKVLSRPSSPYLEHRLERQAATPIDRFILAKLQANGLSMAARADRRTLARRLYFDLLGLPPTPDEVAAFVEDSSPLAYEQLVDRLLASPQYGERWARHWLDVVKYADTCGYDKDKLRPNAWPYRDYVIRAFNEDKPYERFVQEQLAGDILFPGDPDGILGLGFLAAGPWDFIGHVEVPETKIDGKEARHIDRDEMVSNTLNTFNSATIQCCRCHNHKFDPFTQQHYYSLQSVFSAIDRADRAYDLDPAVEHRRRELEGSLKASQAALAELDASIKREGGEQLAAVEKRIAELKPKADAKDKHPAFGYHSNIESEQDREKWVQIDLGREVSISKIVLHPCHDDFGGIGAGFGFPVRFVITAGRHQDSFPVTGSSIGDDRPPKETPNTVTLDDRRTSDLPNPGLVPYTIEVDDTPVRYIRVTATRLAERKNDFILALAEVEVFDEHKNNVALKAPVTALDSIEAPVRWAKANLTDGIWARAADPKASVALADVNKQRNSILDRINTPERIAKREVLNRAIADDTQKLSALPKGRMVYAASTHFTAQGNFKPTMGTPREVRLLYRGDVNSPRETARPGTLPILDSIGPEFDLPTNHSEGDRRAALAHWITHRDHPLTWRSIANRVWLYHFGAGIVDSPNDFGRMGQLPSHTELLDWLAVELRDNGQSIKELHRLIVTSNVYQQDSRVTDESAESAIAVDSGNRLLWRMNRRRLEAEEIRDAILSVSGRMDSSMGGPGFYLFVLEKTAHSPHYEYHLFDPNDPASHRRSVYRFIVRSQPNPFMTTLDCADSSQSTPLRNETLTSLQALSLLNNKFNLAMAEHFARRLEQERPTLHEQLELAMRLVAGRSLTASEREQLENYASTYGIENACRVLFNLSEFVYLD
ncbi:MAG: PSD1 domain-containing protein [Planctomycetaceae bacterium]|nr:PSD1 domain-containing protein [Planctomycetales bacterium]MCB9921502.1 PSD1 domain-containing protein [Planctomycetaceae bacterium]